VDRSPGAGDGGRAVYASRMVMLDSARRKVPVPALARWLLGPGHLGDARGQLGACHGPVGGSGRAAGGRTGRLLRVVHDGHLQYPGGTTRPVRQCGHPGPALEAGGRGIRRSASGGSRSFNSRDPRAAPRRPGPAQRLRDGTTSLRELQGRPKIPLREQPVGRRVTVAAEAPTG
jgi:hypothetical protein